MVIILYHNCKKNQYTKSNISIFLMFLHNLSPPSPFRHILTMKDRLSLSKENERLGIPMDYQRACGCTVRGMQGMGRTPWRAPYAGNRTQTEMPRLGNTDRDGCDCDCTEPLAIVTSPVQCWQNLYTPCEALSAGTLFKDLNLPLVGCINAVPYRKGGGL